MFPSLTMRFESFEPTPALRAQLLRRAQHLCRGHFDAEDLVQEVMTSNLARLRAGVPVPERGMEAVLFRSLTNAFISRLRHAEATERFERGLPMEEPASEAPPDRPETPLWETITDEELAQALEALSPKQREVLTAIGQGERYASIAARLGVSIGAVGKRAFDARQRLRKVLMELMALRGN